MAAAGPAEAGVVTTAHTPALSAQGISVRFGGIDALSNVSVACEAGQVVAVIGPNGAGKSTLFNAICGICRPRAGSVSVAGQDVRRRRVGRASLVALALLLGVGAALVFENVDALWRKGVVAPYRARVLAMRRGEAPPPGLHVAEHLWRDIGGAPWVHAERDGFVVCDAARPLGRAPTLARAEWLRDEAAADVQERVRGRQAAFVARALALAAAAWTWLLRHRRAALWQPRALAAAGVARTFQNIRLFDQLSAEDNVRVVLEQHERASASASRRLRADAMGREVTRLLTEVDLVHRARHRAGALSYGERRRLEIARALALSPAVLLLDEPAAGLHAGETASLLALVRRLRAAGMAILLIEHDMSLVMGVSDAVLVLDHGAPIACGTPAAVRADAKVIAAYLGERSGRAAAQAAQVAAAKAPAC